MPKFAYAALKGHKLNRDLVGYADDVTYSKSILSAEDVEDVDDDLSNIKSWLDRQHMKLNLSKVKKMVISRKKSLPTLKVCIDGHQIESVTSFKLLGVTVTSDLSWRCHITSTCARAKKLLGFLYRVFRLAGTSCLRRLYTALVLPVLDYSSSIWDPSQKVHSLALERVQNFAARIMMSEWACDVEKLKSKLGLPPLSKRRLFQKICLCRRILVGSSIVGSDIFKQAMKSRARHANLCPPLFKPFVRTSHLKSAFHMDVIDKWNVIPERIVSKQLSTN